jgi:hypothetical protein
VYRLRKALDDANGSEHIDVWRKFGVRFKAPVMERSARSSVPQTAGCDVAPLSDEIDFRRRQVPVDVFDAEILDLPKRP